MMVRKIYKHNSCYHNANFLSHLYAIQHISWHQRWKTQKLKLPTKLRPNFYQPSATFKTQQNKWNLLIQVPGRVLPTYLPVDRPTPTAYKITVNLLSSMGKRTSNKRWPQQVLPSFKLRTRNPTRGFVHPSDHPPISPSAHDAQVKSCKNAHTDVCVCVRVVGSIEEDLGWG